MKYPDNFLNEILCGDCLSLMKLIPDNSIDFCFVDPPYNISQEDKKIDRNKIRNKKVRRLMSKRQNKVSQISYDFGKWDNYNSIDEQLEFAEKWLKECYRVLKEDSGQIISFYSKSEISFLESIMTGIGFHVRQTLVYHKINPVPQIFKVGYMSAAEFMTWATMQKGAKHTFNHKLGQIHNVFTYPLCQGNERTEHPTQKPLKLLEKIISYHSNKGDIILDPFMGVGSTCVAAKELGRNYIGIEKEQKYVDIANRRLRQEYFDLCI